MPYFLPLILAFLGVFTAFSSVAAPHIVTTIKPLGLIANDIAGGKANVEILLPDNASPHDYALKPSDIKTLQKASLIFWVGPESERFLVKLLADNPRAIQLSAQPDMPLRYYDGTDFKKTALEKSDLKKQAHKHHEKEHVHEKGHHHDKKGHQQDEKPHRHDNNHSHHEGIDGHIWLGPSQSKVIAKIIASKLSEIDPKNKAHYQKNLKKFIQDVDVTQKEIKSKLDTLLKTKAKAPQESATQLNASQNSALAIKKKGYYLFHDGYTYFEQAFALKPLGHITISPERKPGAKTLVKIRTALQKQDATCIFSEPQFNPSLVKNLTKGTPAKIVMLDPMAKELSLDKHTYVDFLKALGESYQACFRP